FDAAAVTVSVTTLDPELARVLEPRASAPARRLAAIRRLSAAGVRVGVLVAPIIPGLTEHELPEILREAAAAGAASAGYVILRLPWGLKALFTEWLRRHRPERADRVLSRIRDVRQGRLTDHRFGRRQRGTGTYAEQIGRLFEVSRRRVGLAAGGGPLSAAAFRPPSPEGQARLF
ncbi:MAG: radical SAM protein, partial [Thermoanaerobaculia bacterium]|nr:radical SAM protein [Thermoanaerobaculia bacterium]